MAAKAYPALRPSIVRQGETLDHLVMRALGRLHDLAEDATFQLRVEGLPGKKVNATYSVLLTEESGALLQAPPFGRAQLVIVVDWSAMVGILMGSYAPEDAYRDNKLRVVGDLDLARRVFRQVTS